MLSCVMTRGAEMMRAMPSVSAASSARSSVNVPRTFCSENETTGLPAPNWKGPPTESIRFGNTSPVPVPSDGSIVPWKPQLNPYCWMKSLVVSTIRASMTTWRVGTSTESIRLRIVCR